MIRLGLCCVFAEAPIRFRNATATATGRLPRRERLAKLAGLVEENAAALRQAIEFCHAQGIGAFRVNSQVLPLKTHPELGYSMDELPDGERLVRLFRSCGRRARRLGVRLSFHPDQFVVLSSPRRSVVEASLRELEYQAEVASWIGADVVNVHGGGAYGDKAAALERLDRRVRRLSRRARRRLTLENDDRVYTPADLLPVCERLGVPFVYDVHHHRCLDDGLAVEEVTRRALGTWKREPLFHLSSPLEGWRGPAPQRHHDYINARDFPACWRDLDLTVDVEAKAKELAIARLRRSLRRRGVPLWG